MSFPDEKVSSLISFCHIVFQYLFSLYLVLVIINEFKIIAYPTYLNWLLVVVVALGAVSFLFVKSDEERSELKPSDALFIWSIGVLGAVLIFVKIAGLGISGYFISFTAGALIVAVGYSLYGEESKISWDDLGSHSLMIFCIVALAMLLIVSFVVGQFIGFLEGFRAVFGVALALFLPGALLSYAVFPMGEIDMIERLALCFGLSIVVIPMLVFYLSLAGMDLTALNITLLVVIVCILATTYLFFRSQINERVKSIFLSGQR